MSHPENKPAPVPSTHPSGGSVTPGGDVDGELVGKGPSDLSTTSGEIDEEALERLWKRGSEAWAGVDHPAAWVDDLRGH